MAPPDPKVTKAFRAMRAIGISENKVKPVLKKLLKLYDKNWELIEEENYRVLADAIFDEEDAKVSERKKPKLVDQDNFEEESLTNDERLRPLKRLRRGQQSIVPHSPSNSGPGYDETLLRRPKVEENEVPAPSSQQQSNGKAKSPQFNAENVRPENQHLRYKGKEPILPQVASAENISNPERASHAVCIRDPTVEPGIVPLPKKVPSTHVLIKPKDEPFTDDMFTNNTPQHEVPTAMIRPDSMSQGDSSAGNISVQEPVCHEPPAPQQGQGEYRGGGVLAESRSNCKLANISEEPPSLEIASSSMGEEELRSVTPTLDLLKKSTARDCLLVGGSKENRFVPAGILTGLVNKKCSAEQAPPQVSWPLQSLNGLDDHVGTSEEIIANGAAGNDTEKEKEKELKDAEFSHSCGLVSVPLCLLTPDDLRAINDVKDITKAEERVEIPWVNETNNEFPPSFYYISHNLVFQNACVNFSLSRIGDENCCSACFGNCLQSAISCACAHETGRYVYTPEGLLEEEFLEECLSMTRTPQQQQLLNCRDCPLERSRNEGFFEPCKGHLKRNIIKECWSKCGCYKKCGNRVVQRGISCKLQVFLTPDGKGWGLRTLEKLHKGAFVCEFVGEIVTIKEFYERDTGKHNFPVLLDAFWVSEGVSKEEKSLCLDATCYGNVARFLNHRCFDANLIEIPVEIETPEHHYYHLAFFTSREVDAFEELTWDYGMDFDDQDHLLKFRCRCGSKFCRNMNRSSRSKSVSVAR